MSTRRTLTLLALCLVLALTGCAQKPPTAVEKNLPEIGVIEMAKAVRAHPKYPQLETLRKARNQLAFTLQEQQAAAGKREAEQAAIDLSNMNQAAEQQYKTRMTAQEAELNRALQAKAGTLRREANETLDKYVAELDNSYQTRLFNLQLKLKTLALTPEEQAAVQQQMEQIQNERMEKIVARQKELSDQIAAAMREEEKNAAQTLAASGQELQKKLQEQLDKKKQQLSGKVNALEKDRSAGPGNAQDATLAEKDREIRALEQSIVNDIAAKTAQVAQTRGLTSVLADVQTATALAQNITDDVITEIKK